MWKIPLAIVLLAAGGISTRPADKFDFVVIGDTRPRFESENFGVFKSLIPKINALKPAFVINLGDLIYGYGLLRKEKQLDIYQEVVKAFEPPYYQIPGNHDVYSKTARTIYQRRFGKSYESFDYKGCHFVLLDNCEGGQWGDMGPVEIDWLKSDLKRIRTGPVFVFLHFPLWEQERIAPKHYDFWKRTLHPLFQASRVRAVFGGHYHGYGPTREFDGIPYFTTGGGGAELRPEYIKAGGTHHFLKVTVSGDYFEIRVVTDQGELSDGEADVMGGLLFADRHVSWIGLGQTIEGRARDLNFSLSLTNPYPGRLTGSAEWVYDHSAFEVRPETIVVRLAAGEKTVLPFSLKMLQNRITLQSLPRLEFDVAAAGRRHRFSREILFLQELKVPFWTSPPKLDGKLDDWTNVPVLDLDGSVKSNREIRAAYDAGHLYLAVTLPTPKAAADSESFFGDDLQFGIADRISAAEFGADRLRWGISAGTGSAIIAADRTPIRHPSLAAAGIQGAFRKANDLTIYEIAVPAAWLESQKQEINPRLILNFAYRVPEEETKGKRRGEPPPNSFSYQVRFGGGDNLTPVSFIELLLERRNPF